MRYILILLLVASSIFFSDSEHKSYKNQQPNIVLILADDLGFSDLGAYGSEISTPNLDQLADQGVCFTQFYNAARCCPSRASLLTGLYPHQVGMGGMVAHSGKVRPEGPYQGYLRHDSCQTIAEALKPLGYKTYMSGKWHVGEHEKDWPLQRGFDRYFGLISGASSYYELLDEGDRTRIMLLENAPFKPQGDDFYMTDAITNYALEVLDEHHNAFASQPFFLYLAYTAPHWPLHAPDSLIQKYEKKYQVGWDSIRRNRYDKQLDKGLFGNNPPALSNRTEEVSAWPQATNSIDWVRRMATYAAMVERMDEGIGNVLEALREQGQLENTLFLFLSDNGASAENIEGRALDEPTIPTGYPGSYRAYCEPWANVSNTPMRYYKKWIYEGGIATPAILYFQEGHFPAGKCINTPLHLIDIMPTFLYLAGKKQDASNGNLPLPGKNIIQMIKAETNVQNRPLFWEHEGHRAVRLGDWKLVAKAKTDWELYHIAHDRSETQNMADFYPDKVAKMEKLYLEWAQKVGVKLE
ncbi:MAG TPA: arylsulfatase [Saprospiraceae bacterium]|nr:arylsulfatase [Saprospiraceae bacterium]HMQ81438.1 arylsulfatase [Saprospiraceae bacterium]